MRTPVFIAAAISTVILASCAAAPNETAMASADSSEPLNQNTCLRNESISGYQTLDRMHVLVSAPSRSRTYLVTTRNKCREMDHANGLVFKSATTCVTPGDKIIVPDSVSAMSSSCWIDTIERVENKDAALALIEQRATDAKEESAES
ncbi:MAG: hypothetical protein CME88_15235 [Hirschia sp.]|nr:hypothetical protein [Hirschia sp.]MBF19731.1 hypothetical protein [Hirschia sp.]